MTGEQARRRLANVLIETGTDVDETVVEVLEELEEILRVQDDPRAPGVPVHDSEEFLAWLKS